MAGLPKVSRLLPLRLSPALTAMVLALSAVVISSCGQNEAGSQSRPASDPKGAEPSSAILREADLELLPPPSTNQPMSKPSPRASVGEAKKPGESDEETNIDPVAETSNADETNSGVLRPTTNGQPKASTLNAEVGGTPEPETSVSVGNIAYLISCSSLQHDIPPNLGAGVVAFVNGHPVTAVELATMQAQVQCNLADMRDVISRVEQGESGYPEEWASTFGNRVALMEEHGLDAVVLSGVIRDAAVLTTALAAGHSADPVEIAGCVQEQIEYLEQLRRLLRSGNFPELENQPPEVWDVDRNREGWEEVCRESIPVNDWLEELSAKAWTHEERASIQYHAELDAFLAAEVTLVGDPILEATREEAIAYIEAYDAHFPQSPGPPLMCANGITIPNPQANRSLVYDCEALLALKEDMRSTATLNWRADRDITEWNGVTVGGDPARVTQLWLADKGLWGNLLLSRFDALDALTALDLRGNTFTLEFSLWFGEFAIPKLFSNLKELWLSGNSLLGCIPFELQDIEAHDLDSFGDYCLLPTPWHLETDISTPTSVSLSWDSVPSATRYRVEYKEGYGGYTRSNGELISDNWLIADDTIMSTSYTMKGLTCGADYTFVVRAYIFGSDKSGEWSRPSSPHGTYTEACLDPETSDH